MRVHCGCIINTYMVYAVKLELGVRLTSYTAKHNTFYLTENLNKFCCFSFDE